MLSVPIPQPRINWSEWHSLFPSRDIGSAPQSPGIYRVSHTDIGGIQYIGHSRTDLYGRMRRLSSELDSDEMPLRDPHTAAPCLWAIREEYELDYQVSWIPVDIDIEEAIITTDIREIHQRNTRNELIGLQSAYLASYRYLTDQTPTANFGGMISNYRHPSLSENVDSDNESEEEANVPTVSHDETIPSWDNWENVTAEDWMGFNWEEEEDPRKFSDPFPPTSGLYRIWETGEDELMSVGATTDIRDRIYTLMEVIEVDIRASYYERPMKTIAERQALTTDLIGAHYMARRVGLDSDILTNRLGKNQVRDLANDFETEEVECKGEFPDNHIIRKDIVALGNRQGGFYIQGVPEPGVIKGVEHLTQYDDPQKVEERLVNLVESVVEPASPIQRTQIVEFDEGHLVVIEVRPAADIPYSENARFYKREGSTSEAMDGHDLQRFLQEET